MSRLHVPEGQLLSPRELLSRPTAKRFPFDAPRAEYFYLARNGIWYGVDALGLKPGDEVLMPAYHHGVEVEVLKAKGLSVKYYRIDERMGMDLQHVESLVGERTRLLYVIHYLGWPQPVREVLDLVGRHGLLLFEDCALSLFAEVPDGPLGSFGQVSIFCLYKTIAVPHGGVMVLNAPELRLPSGIRTPDWKSTTSYVAKQLLAYLELKGGAGLAAAMRGAARTFKRAGQIEPVRVDTMRFEERFVDLGVSRATRHILDRVDAGRVVSRRRENYARLDEMLSAGIRRVFDGLPPGVCPLSFPILVRDKEAAHAALEAQGVGTITFWSIDNPEIPRGTFPEVDFLRRHVLEIPIHHALGTRHMERIAVELEEHARW